MQSLGRIISILEAVAGAESSIGAAEVARARELPLSTAARLMNQLAAEDMLHRSSDGRYVLGPRLLAFAHAAASQIDLTAIARPILEHLRNVTGETATLHVLRGGRRVCIAQVESQHEVRRVVQLGLAELVPGTATGEVLLAGASLPERRAAFEMLGRTERELRVLEERLDRIRSDGYALVVDDWVAGLAGLSAAVVVNGIAIAAISVSGPSARFSERAARQHAGTILEAARELSGRLGARSEMYEIEQGIQPTAGASSAAAGER